MADFCIWIVTPPEYMGSRCFDELALTLREAFAALGYDAPIVTERGAIRGVAIVLAPQLLERDTRMRGYTGLPQDLILYNLEQIYEGAKYFTSEYIDLLRRYPVWDYSAQNVARLHSLGIRNVSLCGVGYMPALTRFPETTEDLGIVFVGSINERRRCVIDEVAELCGGVTLVLGMFGDARDAIYARAKIVLNVHYYNSQIFEIVRVSYLLANRKCVVSESGLDDSLEGPLRDGVAFASYDDLADTCVRLLADHAERARIASRGFDAFTALSQVPMLERALAGLR